MVCKGEGGGGGGGGGGGQHVNLNLLGIIFEKAVKLRQFSNYIQHFVY